MTQTAGWMTALPALIVAILGLVAVALMTIALRIDSARVAVLRLPWSAPLPDILSGTDLAIIDITSNDQLIIFDAPRGSDIRAEFARFHVWVFDGDAALSCLGLLRASPLVAAPRNWAPQLGPAIGPLTEGYLFKCLFQFLPYGPEPRDF